MGTNNSVTYFVDGPLRHGMGMKRLDNSWNGKKINLLDCCTAYKIVRTNQSLTQLIKWNNTTRLLYCL